LQSQSKKFRISIAYLAYIISFVINFVDLSSFEIIENRVHVILILETEFFQVNTNVIIYINNSLSKLWKRTLIQNEDEMKRRWRLKETERVINKTTIIIHSCLHFIVSTTQFNQRMNNVYALFTHYYCHLRQLYITYTIYNVIYTHYNWRWIIIQSKVSLFLVFSQRFEGFYRELLEWNHEYTSSFIRVNKDINYWDWEWTHLEKKTIIMMN